MPDSKPHSALEEARLALHVWMKGQQPSRDHPGVVLEDCLDRIEEQLEAAQKVIEAARLPSSWITRDGISTDERDMQQGWDPLYPDLTAALIEYDASYPASEPKS